MPVRARAFFIIVVVANLLVFGFSCYPIIMPRTVARAVAPDGTEMCVIQTFNWSPELFTTRFVFRKPGGPWGSFYYDHQDGLWAGSRVSLDPATQVAVFFRDGAPVITFAWTSETYQLQRPGWNRTVTGPQWKLPADWSPP